MSSLRIDGSTVRVSVCGSVVASHSFSGAVVGACVARLAVGAGRGAGRTVGESAAALAAAAPAAPDAALHAMAQYLVVVHGGGREVSILPFGDGDGGAPGPASGA